MSEPDTVPHKLRLSLIHSRENGIYNEALIASFLKKTKDVLFWFWEKAETVLALIRRNLRVCVGSGKFLLKQEPMGKYYTFPRICFIFCQ